MAEPAYRRAFELLKVGKASRKLVEIQQQARQSPFLSPAALQSLGLETPASVNGSSTHEMTIRIQREVTEIKRAGERDAVRRSLLKLAQHHAECGEFQMALSQLAEARDLDATNPEIVETGMLMLTCSFQGGILGQMPAQISRIRRAADPKNELLAQEIAACAGLAHFRSRNFRAAATEILQTSLDLKDQFGEVTSIRELAGIGVMCCLATQTRAEIKTNLLEGNRRFRELLEMVSPWRAIVSDYIASRFAKAFAALDEMTPDRKLEMNLGVHWDSLLGEARDRAIVQYFSPFLKIRLSSLGTVFGMEPATLETHIARLIQSDSLQARIDRHENVLIAKVKDLRSSTFTHAFKVGTDFSKDISTMLMNLSLVEHRFALKDPTARQKQEAGPVSGRRRREDGF